MSAVFINGEPADFTEPGPACIACGAVGEPYHWLGDEGPFCDDGDACIERAIHGYERDLGTCPYYQGTGTCGFGCRDEPECQTGEPMEGWPTKRAQP